MTLVVDASAVAAALGVPGNHGIWARKVLDSDDVAAPQLMPVEVANTLRRSVLAGHISNDSAKLAHRQLLEMPVALLPYEPFARRAWELGSTMTIYDAWYVALAESLKAPLVTLDIRSSRASGPRCEFRLPPDLVAEPS